jgi:hypothetical protein
MNINLHNYEEYLIDYLHGELDPAMAKSMQALIDSNASVAEEYELLKQTIFTPDETIVFENKHFLLREDQENKLVVSYKKYYAVAAAIIGLLMGLFFMLKKDTTPDVVVTKPSIEDTVLLNHEHEPVQKQEEAIANTETKTPSVAVPQKTYSPPSNKTTPLQPKKENNPIIQQPIQQQPEQVIVNNYKENKPAPIQTPPLIDTTTNTVIAHDKQLPKVEEIQEKNPAIATHEKSSRALELDPKRQPRLFKAINGLLGLKRTIKNTQKALANTEVVVMVGNKVLLNFNN